MFGKSASGKLLPISGVDPNSGAVWHHAAFIPDPLPDSMPSLQPETYLRVANARAALAALDSTARQLPNPQLFRHPALRREAQSTSALEGTYAPLSAVLTVDEDDEPADHTDDSSHVSGVVDTPEYHLYAYLSWILDSAVAVLSTGSVG